MVRVTRLARILMLVLATVASAELEAAEPSVPAKKPGTQLPAKTIRKRKPASTGAQSQSSLTAPSRTAPNLLSISTGFSSVSFQQTGLAPVSALILTPKIDFRHQFGQSRWSFGINTFFSAATLSSNLPADTSMGFIGVNWRLAYRLTEPRNPWNIELSGGTYYETMMVSDQAFGFQNLIGPQTVLRMARAVTPSRRDTSVLRMARAVTPSRRDTSFVAAYAKYALMTEGFRLTNMANRETAFGLSWAGRIVGAPVSIMADYATLDLTSDTDTITLRSVTLGAGYRLSF